MGTDSLSWVPTIAVESKKGEEENGQKDKDAHREALGQDPDLAHMVVLRVQHAVAEEQKDGPELCQRLDLYRKRRAVWQQHLI